MAIFNLGSINADLSYSVDAFPEPGETISAHSVSRGLGGKGTNMSVAAARAAAHVVHIGAVGRDGGRSAAPACIQRACPALDARRRHVRVGGLSLCAWLLFAGLPADRISDVRCRDAPG